MPPSIRASCKAACRWRLCWGKAYPHRCPSSIPVEGALRYGLTISITSAACRRAIAPFLWKGLSLQATEDSRFSQKIRGPERDWYFPPRRVVVTDIPVTYGSYQDPSLSLKMTSGRRSTGTMRDVGFLSSSMDKFFS